MKEKPQKTVQEIVDQGQTYGRAGAMQEAIDCFSQALAERPFEGIFYRYRGHRHLSLLQNWQGVADLTVAASLIPDNWDVWYHLGLGYYLLGEDEKALQAYRRCHEMTESEELLVAIVDWMVLTLMNLDRREEALALAKTVPDDADPGENVAYFKRVLVYKGSLEASAGLNWFLDENNETINRITFGYGFSRYLEWSGEDEQAQLVRRQMLELAGDSSLQHAFAILAAKARSQA